MSEHPDSLESHADYFLHSVADVQAAMEVLAAAGPTPGPAAPAAPGDGAQARDGGAR